MTPTIKMEHKREPCGGSKTKLGESRNASLCWHLEDCPVSAMFL
jgi:hypothetical protein